MGSSSIGGASAFEAEGCGFDPRLPCKLHRNIDGWWAATVPVAFITAFWNPGSYDPPWSWLDETAEIIAADGPEFGALINHIRINGIQKPVKLGNDDRVWDGHHRICAAWIIGPTTMVPFALPG